MFHQEVEEELSPFASFLEREYVYPTQMYTHFDLTFVPTLGRVSKTAASLFSADNQTIWRSLLLGSLTETEQVYFETIFPLRGSSFQFKNICQRMKSVFSLLLEEELKAFYLHPSNAFTLMLIAANVSGDNLLLYLKRHEHRMWLRLAIALHSNESVMTLWESLKEDVSRIEICEWAALAKNKTLICELIEADKKIISRLEDDFFHAAIHSGDTDMAQFVLEDAIFSEKEFVVDQDAMEAAGLSGSIKMYDYLWERLKEDEFILIEDVFVAATMVGCLEIAKRLVKDYPAMLDELTEHDVVESLRFAAKARNEALLRYLIDIFPTVRITPRVLEAGAKSGNIEIFEFLYAHFVESSDAWIPKSILDAAAESNNLKMARHILHKFNVKPDQDTLACSTHAGMMLLKYFRHPYFRLSPSGSTIEAVARSRNLLGLYYLLDPAKGFNLVVKELMIASADFVMKPFLRANANIRRAFVHIAHDSLMRAHEKLCKAIELSIIHFFDLVVDVCLYPSRYAMTKKMIKLLIKHVDKVLETVLPKYKCSYVELDAVYKTLVNAGEVVGQLEDVDVNKVFCKWLKELQAVDKRQSVGNLVVGWAEQSEAQQVRRATK